MIKEKVSLIGLGSIGQKHLKYLKKYLPEKNVQIISSKELSYENSSKNLEDILNFDPGIIIVCTPTSNHLDICNFIEKNLVQKIVLVEKPIFNKVENFNAKKNTYFCAYNFRFHQGVAALKKEISNEKYRKVEIRCLSYLPNWRKSDYRRSYSASVAGGGGVALDLSHEIDLALYLFGNFTKKFYEYSKKSNLEIETKDYLLLNGVFDNDAKCVIELNYASKSEVRDIMVESEDKKWKLDFLSHSLSIIEKKNEKNVKIVDIGSVELTYDHQIKKLLNGDLKLFCTFDEAIEVVKLVDALE